MNKKKWLPTGTISGRNTLVPLNLDEIVRAVKSTEQAVRQMVIEEWNVIENDGIEYNPDDYKLIVGESQIVSQSGLVIATKN